MAGYEPPTLPKQLPPTVTNRDFAEAVVIWLHGGKWEDVSALVGLPRAALRDLYVTEAWIDAAMQLRPRLRQIEATVLTNLISKAMQRVAERLEGGDIIVDNKGNQRVVPVKAKDAAQIAAIFMDRRKELHREIDGVVEKGAPEEVENILRIAAALNQRYDVTPKREAIEGEKEFIDG